MHQAGHADNQPFLDHHHIPADRVLSLPDQHPFLGYHRYGMLKVLVQDGEKVLWFELGSKSDAEYEEFSLRLQAAIDNYGVDHTASSHE
jgi:hypothetical protein